MPKKDGLTWISQRNKQLRYSVGGDDQWIQPMSIYIAGETILRGQAVSVALPSDFVGTTKVIDSSITDDDSVVVLTRTDRHLKMVGIALEPATPGQKVHVQPFGQFCWAASTTSTEFSPGFVNADRGKLVYVSSTPGDFTLDATAAALGGLRLIQVGFISSTPATGLVTIELQPEGDGRGPLDQTQFEGIFGEEVAFPPTPLGGQYPKVFAISPSPTGTLFQYNVRASRPSSPWPSVGDLAFNTWIALYTNNRVHIVIFGNATTPSATDTATLNSIINSVPSANVTYSNLYSQVTAPAGWGTPWSSSAAPITPFTSALATALTTFAGQPLTGLSVSLPGAQVGVVSQIVNNLMGTQASVDILLQGSVAFGPVYIQWDTALDGFLAQGSHILQQGSYTVSTFQGSAVLADRSIAARTNLLGFFLGQPQSGLYLPGAKGIFLRKGLLSFTDSFFTPGQEYYLGTNGQITPFPASIPANEPLVYIGTALSTKTLLVDISGVRSSQRVADYPIGALKPLPIGVDVAEYSFLLCDGITAYNQTDFPQMYADLVARYGSSVNHNGTQFVIPNLTHPVFGNHFQMKATPYGNQASQHSTSVIRTAGVFPVTGVDVTAFITSGPQGVTELPTLDRIIPKLFVEKTLNQEDWIEAQPGTYAWEIHNTSGVYTLNLDITGSAITYWNGLSLVPVSTERYKILVYKTDLFTKYVEFDADIAKITLSTIDVAKTAPVNSVAVVSYIASGVTTDHLVVQNGTQLGDAATDVVSVKGSIQALKAADSSVQATWSAETGDIKVTNLDANNLPTGATANSLMPKAFVDAHINANFGASVKVHGFLVGPTSVALNANTFNVDRVDNLHVGSYANPHRTDLDPTTMFIPFVDATEIRVGSRVQLESNVGAQLAAVQTIVANQVDLLGSTDAVNVVVKLGGGIFLSVAGVGALKVGSTAGAQDGVITAQSFNTGSARALKENIFPSELNALHMINSVNVVAFNYIGDTVSKIGFIADETDSLLSTPERNSMDIANTLGVLIKAVQELDDRWHRTFGK